MFEFFIKRNLYLKKDINGFYNTPFYGSRDYNNNPNYLYKIKNDPHHNWTDQQLKQAQLELFNVLYSDLPHIYNKLRKQKLYVCVVPRAKAEEYYRDNQKIFKHTVSNVINSLGRQFYDGTNYVLRHKNTKTTHLRREDEFSLNDGMLPFVGITKDTCTISNDVIGKDILLIDDIYTETVNIDEDVIQALIDKGANSVTFYAVAKTE